MVKKFLLLLCMFILFSISFNLTFAEPSYPKLLNDFLITNNEYNQDSNMDLILPQNSTDFIKDLNDFLSLNLSESEIKLYSSKIMEELYPKYPKIENTTQFLIELEVVTGINLTNSHLEDIKNKLKEHKYAPLINDVIVKSANENLGVSEYGLLENVPDETAPYLGGSTFVLIIFVNRPGESWANNTDDRGYMLGQVGAATTWMTSKAPSSALVSFVYGYNIANIQTIPKNFPLVNDNIWAEEAMNNLGYSDADNDGTKIDDMLNFIKTTFNTNNAIAIFVPHMEGRAYARVSGPPYTVVWFYDYCYTFCIKKEYPTIAHESLHLFGAADEYYSPSDGTGCGCPTCPGLGCLEQVMFSYPPLRPYYPNGNCEYCNTNSVDCVMKYHYIIKSNPDAIEYYTKGQIGWLDYDSDGILDPMDNCINISNPTQSNNDNDSLGDVCDPDDDNDGYNGIDSGGADCNDNNPNINPGMNEICNDLLDNNCNGQIDENCNTCIVPTSGMEIYNNVILCGGTYKLNEGLKIKSDNIKVDCNGSILIGNNTGKGVDIQYYKNVTIKNCTIKTFISGINLIGTRGVLVYNNSLDNNIYFGIAVKDLAINNTITNNKIYNSSEGVFIYASNYTYVFNNIIKNSSNRGISSWYYDNSIVINNTLLDNSEGIYLIDCDYCQIINNTLWNSSYMGISIYYSSPKKSKYNLIYGNRLYNNNLSYFHNVGNYFCFNGIGNFYQNALGPSCDLDNDTYYDYQDCNDLNYNINPNANERCNNVDDNCNGQIDENLVELQSCGIGVCSGGQKERSCSLGQLGGWGECSTANLTTNEMCDGLDNDCDGQSDENNVCFNCTPGEQQSRLCGVTDIGECQFGTETRICQPSGEWSNWNGCNAINPSEEVCNDSLDNDCDNEIDEDCSIGGLLELTVNSPLDGIKNERRVPFEVQANMEVDNITYVDYSDTRPSWKRLCVNCEEYGISRTRTKSLRDGRHNITIKATENGSSIEKSKYLFIDSKDPKIKRTNPRGGKYTNGTFEIQWEELNTNNIVLHHQDAYSGGAISRTDCPYDPEERTQSCLFEVDLMQYHGQEIEYWFDIIDIAGNNDTSRVYIVNVDTLSPVITKLEHKIIGRKVYFDIEVSEEVKLEYMDTLDSISSWESLCTRCSSYNMYKYFSYGNHYILIRARDNAENSDIKDIQFVIN